MAGIWEHNIATNLKLSVNYYLNTWYWTFENRYNITKHNIMALKSINIVLQPKEESRLQKGIQDNKSFSCEFEETKFMKAF